MIVIINGPCGVGKTEVSWNLVERFPEGVILDGDHIGAVYPFEIYDQQRIAYLYQTIRHLTAFHIEHGHSNFVVNYVFETPESLAQLRGMLSELDAVTYVFRLTGSERAMERRIRARATNNAAWELERFRELDAIMTCAPMTLPGRPNTPPNKPASVRRSATSRCRFTTSAARPSRGWTPSRSSTSW